jgi:dienelactone hydrolase
MPTRNRIRAGLVGIALALAVQLPAQTSIFYPARNANALRVTSVQFGLADTVPLRMNVYRARTATRKQPLLLFFHPKLTANQPRSPFIEAWAKVAAGAGLVAAFPDIRFGNESSDLTQAIRYLKEQGDRQGIDTSAIALYAGSGPGATAFPILQNPQFTDVKAAVLFYAGGSNLKTFRRDLPILFVRAGLDRPQVNQRLDELVSAMLAQNVPISVINNAGGYHAFEGRNDDAVTRALIEQTLDFVKRATNPSYQAALRRALPEVIAAGHVTAREFPAAAAAYADLVRARPDDATLRLSYAEALLGATQYSAACAEFDKLRGKGLGARDLGVPAARACALMGDAGAALAWLQGIPKRFLPPTLATDTAFTSLRDRAEFKALFTP